MGSIVIAGTHSSVGKTTVTVGIIDALRRRGLKVQPFKVGPDYIDPSYHTLVVRADNRRSRNLDSWMIPSSSLLELYHRAMLGADVGVVEGVMGLYDGYSGGDDSGSTAQIAKLLKAPVILVMDVSHSARSAAATLKGFKEFDPGVNMAGVILNFVGSANHLKSVTEAIGNNVGVPVLGHLTRDSGLVLPQRHLGLVPTAEKAPQGDFQNSLAKAIDANFNIEFIYNLAKNHQHAPPAARTLFPVERPEYRVPIGVASDEAFNFYYQDNLDLLEAWGGEIVPFSPLHDPALPEGIGGIYLGGGFPELFASQLSENSPMVNEIQAVASKGMPVYAECGGLIYLSQSITDFQGVRYPMVGLVPGETVMTKDRLSLGYVEVEALCPDILMDTGEIARGHEFHYSQWNVGLPVNEAAYKLLNKGNKLAGFVSGNILASYIHVHFASNSKLAPRFIRSCRRVG